MLLIFLFPLAFTLTLSTAYKDFSAVREQKVKHFISRKTRYIRASTYVETLNLKLFKALPSPFEERLIKIIEPLIKISCAEILLEVTSDTSLKCRQQLTTIIYSKLIKSFRSLRAFRSAQFQTLIKSFKTLHFLFA